MFARPEVDMREQEFSPRPENLLGRKCGLTSAKTKKLQPSISKPNPKHTTLFSFTEGQSSRLWFARIQSRSLALGRKARRGYGNRVGAYGNEVGGVNAAGIRGDCDVSGN